MLAQEISIRRCTHYCNSMIRPRPFLTTKSSNVWSDVSPMQFRPVTMENGKAFRRDDHGLPDYNDPQGPNPRHLYHLVGRPTNWRSNDQHIHAEAELVIFTEPSMTVTLKPLGTLFFPSLVVFSCSQYGALLSAALGS